MKEFERLYGIYRFVLLGLGVSAAIGAPACGSSNGAFASNGTPDAGAPLGFNGGSGSLGFSGAPGSGGSSVGASGAPAAGGATGAGTGGASSVAPCTGIGCGVGPNPAGKPPNASCTKAAECQTGRCEPVTGTTNEVCLGACFADGVACTKALDCCSTGCHGGVCGGLCTLENDPCKTDAECCSNLCDPTNGRCMIDHANPDCRPTGEDCTSGEGSGCCNSCNKATKRCAFGKDTCFAQGVACTADADCCHGACTAGVCKTPCAANGATCATAGDCCSADCGAAGLCVVKPPPANPPPNPDGGTPITTACKTTGTACATAAQCCSSICFGGFCDTPPS